MNRETFGDFNILSLLLTKTVYVDNKLMISTYSLPINHTNWASCGKLDFFFHNLSIFSINTKAGPVNRGLCLLYL